MIWAFSDPAENATPGQRVYVVQWANGIEHDACVSIWMTEALAREEAERLNREHGGSDDYSVAARVVLAARRPASGEEQVT